MQSSVINVFEESVIKNSHLPSEWKSQKSLDDLLSFLQFNWEQRSVFFDDGDISSKQQFVSFTGQKGIRTNDYIGTIVFNGQQLNIFPKVFREDATDHDTSELDLDHLMLNLNRWIEYCNKISYPFVSISSDLSDINSLKELFITLYLKYVKATLDYSLFFRYEDRTEDLGYVRGKINYSDYIRRKMPNGKNHLINCSYSEFEFDNIVNRIIKCACKYIQSDNISPQNRKLLSYILSKLGDVEDVFCKPSDCDDIRLSKLNSKYTILLSMSKIILLNQVSNYKVDNYNSFCFLFPTEYLFEGFISGFIAEHLAGSAKVRVQASEKTLIDDVQYGGVSYGKAFKMKHDILFEHVSSGLFILDAKYKELDRFDGNDDIKTMLADRISQNDLYQVSEYALKRNIRDVHLLYPMYRYESEEPLGAILKQQIDGNEIRIHVLRIPFVFEKETDKVLSSLKNVIDKIVSRSDS